MDVDIKEIVVLTGMVGGVATSIFTLGGTWALLRFHVSEMRKRLDEHDTELDDHEHRLSRVEVVCSVNHPEKARG